MSLKNIITKILVIFVIMQFLMYSGIINIKSLAKEDEKIEDRFSQEELLRGTPGGLPIYSESCVLMEARTGKVLYEKGMHDRKFPASTTKTLTAIIVIENCGLNEVCTASHEAVSSIKSGYTKADIQEGESFTVEQLLDVMMLQSANEAANILAEHVSGSISKFAELMNKKAKSLGCNDSNFVNANGEHNENHYSSAYDLATIARYAMKNETFRNIVSKMECSLPDTDKWGPEQTEAHGERKFKNTNQLMIPDSKYYYQYTNGIKAGYTTPAKNCLISGANKNGFELISVILHAETTEDGRSARYLDTINLFEYGYNTYRLEDILNEYNQNGGVINNIKDTGIDKPTPEPDSMFAEAILEEDKDHKKDNKQDKEKLEIKNNKQNKEQKESKDTLTSKHTSGVKDKKSNPNSIGYTFSRKESLIQISIGLFILAGAILILYKKKVSVETQNCINQMYNFKLTDDNENDKDDK